MGKARILSLLPAATEIVCALDCGAQLVGRSHECDFPAGVAALPVCTVSEVPATLASGELDAAVRVRTEAGQPVFRLDPGQLRRLRPDIVITQAQCGVCAVDETAVRAAFERWTGSRPQILALSPRRLADLWGDIQRVATTLRVADDGKALLAALKGRCVDVIQRTCVLGRRPSVVCLEWIDPLMGAGNWVPELVQLAGGQNLAGTAGEHTAEMTWDSLRELNPDNLVIMPCGFDLARTRMEAGALTRQPGWNELRAVKSGRVYLTDGSAYFNRPGPRLVDSLEILAEIIHPGLFVARHRENGWERAPTNFEQ